MSAPEPETTPVDPNEIVWYWRPQELDLSEESLDVETAVKLYTSDVITLDEARARLGEDAMPDESEWGGKLHIEIKAALLPQGGGGAGGGGSIGGALDEPPVDEHAAALEELKTEIRARLHPGISDQDDLS